MSSNRIQLGKPGSNRSRRLWRLLLPVIRLYNILCFVSQKRGAEPLDGYAQHLQIFPTLRSYHSQKSSTFIKFTAAENVVIGCQQHIISKMSFPASTCDTRSNLLLSVWPHIRNHHLHSSNFSASGLVLSALLWTICRSSGKFRTRSRSDQQ